MKKKIHVMTVKATGHIPVDPTSQDSLGEVAGHVTALRAQLEKIGFGVTVDFCLNRVPVPPPLPLPEPETTEPEPEPGSAGDRRDNLDVPPNLVRTAEPKAAE